jgi:tetraacyldisaccharide 4'-kinase
MNGMNHSETAQKADVKKVVAQLPPFNCPKETEARPYLKPFVGFWIKWGSRQSNYAAAPEKSPIPVISVGGLSAGGTGKTPISAWLAEQDEHIWISSRGYRRPQNGPYLRTGDGMGDEAEMLRRRGLKVVSCPDRVKAAYFAAENGAKALVVDDGFQYKRLQRHLNICCINVHWPRSRGQIPVGWARESWDAHERANILWLHNYDPDLPIPQLINRPKVRSRLVPGHWLHKGERYPVNHLSGKKTVAVGIAHPSGFITTLHQIGIGISQYHVVPDHSPLPVLPPGCLVTEKDAARLPRNADVWTLCMRLEIENSHFILDQLNQCLSSPVF